MKINRLLFLVAVTSALLFIFGIAAFAEQEGIFTYTVTGGEATVTKVAMGGLDEIVVPDTLGGYPVTALAKNLFSGKYISNNRVLNGDFHETHPLRRVTLPDGVKELPEQLFMMQYSLEEVRLPSELETIESLCFSYCVSLKHIDFPDTLTRVASGAFCDCWSLEEAVFPESLQSLGKGTNGAVFAYVAGLKYVYLPVGVSSISNLYSNEVYDGQSVLFHDIYYGGTEEQFNALTSNRIAWVDYHFDVDRTALLGEPESLFTVAFSDGVLTVSGETDCVFSEGDTRPWDAYRGETETLVLEGGIHVLGADAFANFPVLSIVIIRSGAVEIASGAFADCPALTDVISLDGCSAARDAFPAENAVNVFSEGLEAPVDANWNPVPVSYKDGTLTYGGSLTQNAYDFFDILSVFCGRFGEIDRLNVVDFAFEGVPIYYYDPESGNRTRINDSLKNGEIYPQMEDNGEVVPVSFNSLCEGVTEKTIDSFYLVINDETHPVTEDTPVRIVDWIQSTIKKVLRTIVTLLNKLFRLLKTFSSN